MKTGINNLPNCAENLFGMKSNTSPGSEKKLQPDNKKPVISDEELASRIIKGDSWAGNELMQRYWEKAFNISFSMCDWDKEEAKDLTQEAFLKVIRNIKKFKGKSSFYTWFYRIVINTCLDARKKKNRWKKIFSGWGLKNKGNDEPDIRPMEEIPDTGVLANPMTSLRGKMLNIEVQKALSSLSEKQQTAFKLKVYHEMTVPEIAQVMNTAQGTIKTHIFRATQYLRKNLKQWDN